MFSTTCAVIAGSVPSRVITRPRRTTVVKAGVLLHPLVVERQQLVAGGRQPHGAVAVHDAVAVDVAAGQLEVELRAQRRPLRAPTVTARSGRAGSGSARSRRCASPRCIRLTVTSSKQTVNFSVACSAAPALSALTSTLCTQQLMKL